MNGSENDREVKQVLVKSHLSRPGPFIFRERNDQGELRVRVCRVTNGVETEQRTPSCSLFSPNYSPGSWFKASSSDHVSARS